MQSVSGKPLLQGDRKSPSASTASSTIVPMANSVAGCNGDSKGGGDGVRCAVVNCHYHRIVLGSMIAAGLFFPRHFNSLCTRRWQTPLLAYSTVIMILLIVNTLRLLVTVFDSSDRLGDGFFHKVNVTCWLFVCAINFVIHYVMSFSQQHGLHRYYIKTVAVRKDFYERGICTKHESMGRIEIACLVVGWLLVASNTVYMLHSIVAEKSGLFPTDVYYRLVPLAANVTPSAGVVVASQVLYGLTAFYYSAAWIWPVVYFVDVSMHASHLFDDFNKHLLVALKRGSLLAEIGMYRQLHRRACKVLCIANGYFKYTLGCHMFFYLVLSMVLLYSVLWSTTVHDPANVDLLVALIVWLGASVAILVVECVAASMTSSRARECLEILLKLNEKKGEVGNTELLEMQLFITKLNCSIGFTSMDMFVVSKEATLTVMGAWLTYFLLIVQFHPPS